MAPEIMLDQICPNLPRGNFFNATPVAIIRSWSCCTKRIKFLRGANAWIVFNHTQHWILRPHCPGRLNGCRQALEFCRTSKRGIAGELQEIKREFHRGPLCALCLAQLLPTDEEISNWNLRPDPSGPTRYLCGIGPTEEYDEVQPSR